MGSLFVNPTAGQTDELKAHLRAVCLGLKRFYGKKTELKNEVTKRKHEEYVQHEDRDQVGRVERTTYRLHGLEADLVKLSGCVRCCRFWVSAEPSHHSLVSAEKQPEFVEALKSL